MKSITIMLALSFLNALAFAQATPGKPLSQSVVSIQVPDFADPEIKAFYQAYADHLLNCIRAIREKNETKVTALFKDPGEQLVEKRKKLSPEVIKNPAEKEKYMQFAKQVYPYIKELEQSVYYQKLYGK